MTSQELFAKIGTECKYIKISIIQKDQKDKSQRDTFRRIISITDSGIKSTVDGTGVIINRPLPERFTFTENGYIEQVNTMNGTAKVKVEFVVDSVQMPVMEPKISRPPKTRT